MPRGLLRSIFLGTLVAGTLDILAAVLLTLAYGRVPADMLRYVASGPFPAATDWATAGAVLGLAVHFALMAVMAALYVVVAAGRPALLARPVRWGVLYGLVTYVVMNLIVVPLRWPARFPPSPVSIGTQLFCHILLVGIPIALIAARHLKNRRLGN